MRVLFRKGVSLCERAGGPAGAHSTAACIRLGVNVKSTCLTLRNLLNRAPTPSRDHHMLAVALAQEFSRSLQKLWMLDGLDFLPMKSLRCRLQCFRALGSQKFGMALLHHPNAITPKDPIKPAPRKS